MEASTARGGGALDITILVLPNKALPTSSSRFEEIHEIYNSTRTSVLLGSANTASHLRPRGSTCSMSYRRSKLIIYVSRDVINSFCKTGENDQFRVFPNTDIQPRLGTPTLSIRLQAAVCCAGYSQHSAATNSLEIRPAR